MKFIPYCELKISYILDTTFTWHCSTKTNMEINFFLKPALSVARILHSLHRHGSAHVHNYDSTL
ncbi:hypothetical protein T06_15216 [Trichinella sp. T6]|nr:hypothetical protein T06_15216 [Trichinella sp. T6]